MLIKANKSFAGNTICLSEGEVIEHEKTLEIESLMRAGYVEAVAIPSQAPDVKKRSKKKDSE